MIESFSHLHPITPGRIRQKKISVFGFDTEYTSDGGELLSVQLYGEHGGSFTEIGKLDAEILSELVQSLRPEHPDILLVSYFSLAEMQFMPIFNGQIRILLLGQTADFAFDYNKITYHVFDIIRFFNGAPLWKAADSFGLEKLEYDTEHVTRETIKIPAFRTYALHDAYLCYEIFTRLRRQFLKQDVDLFYYRTPASAAAAIFKMKAGPLERTLGRPRKLALRGSWGGRAEVFERGDFGEVEFKEYDFNSAYSRACIRLALFPEKKDWRPVYTLRKLDHWRGGFLKVAFEFSDDVLYPCLPVYYEGKMYYPLKGVSTCTIEEIRVALRMGAKLNLYEGYAYRTGTRVLADFMSWALEKRRGAEGELALLFKLIANSLTGKFIQSCYAYNIEDMRKLAVQAGLTLDKIIALAPEEKDCLGVVKTLSLGSVHIPEWYGLITGYTRAALAEMIETSDPIYCHTDSVWARRKPRTDLLPFSLKGTGKAVVLRSRLARLGDHIARHGIRSVKGAKEIFDSGKLEGIYEYEHERPIKVLEAARRKKTAGRWETETIKIDLGYDHKRKLLSNGQSRPWEHMREYRQFILDKNRIDPLDWRHGKGRTG